MGMRVAETEVRADPRGPGLRVRVDLHGVSSTGADGERKIIRWEWIEQITVGEGVVVTGAGNQVDLPPGTFGQAPEAMAALLGEARAIDRRPEVIEKLAGLAR